MDDDCNIQAVRLSSQKSIEITKMVYDLGRAFEQLGNAAQAVMDATMLTPRTDVGERLLDVRKEILKLREMHSPDDIHPLAAEKANLKSCTTWGSHCVHWREGKSNCCQCGLHPFQKGD